MVFYNFLLHPYYFLSILSILVTRENVNGRQNAKVSEKAENHTTFRHAIQDFVDLQLCLLQHAMNWRTKIMITTSDFLELKYIFILLILHYAPDYLNFIFFPT